jgi:hypothetical protein
LLPQKALIVVNVYLRLLGSYFQIHFRKKAEQGLADSKAGNFVPDDEMERFWRRWLGQ